MASSGKAETTAMRAIHKESSDMMSRRRSVDFPQSQKKFLAKILFWFLDFQPENLPVEKRMTASKNRNTNA